MEKQVATPDDRRRFIIRHGVLAWGVPVALVWALLMWGKLGGPLWRWVAIALALFPLAGWLFGAALWRGRVWMQAHAPAEEKKVR